MSINISPQQRVEEFDGELGIREGQLVCIWCNDKPLNHRRRDQILDHIRTKSHQERRVAGGVGVSYDVDSAEAIIRKRRRRMVISKHTDKLKKEKSLHSSIDSDIDAANLRKLFDDSDSDSSGSFEGFQSPSNTLTSSDTYDEHDSRRSSGRSRKRPARLSDSFAEENIAKIGKIADQAAFVSSMARRRTAEEYSSPSSQDNMSPPRIRSMPIKKQISFSARQSDPPSPISPTKGSLKMKFSRTVDKSKPQYSVKPEKNLKVVSKSAPGKGLKLKFVWKKKKYSKNSTDTTSSDLDSSGLNDSVNSYEEMLKGMETQTPNRQTVQNEEVVEEEIVDMNDQEVVTEQDLAQIENEVPVVPQIPVNTISETKAALSRAALKQPKPEPVTKRTPKPKIVKKPVMQERTSNNNDKKRKMTGYMLWAKQTRESVARKYPGLEFGDVSKKLGDLWKKMPEKEKQMWKLRTTKMVQKKPTHMPTTIRKSGSRMIETGPKKKPPSVVAPTPYTHVKNPEAAMRQELSRLQPPSIEPLDSAAYLSLLSESLGKLSAKTKKVESKIIIQGAETILLDSLVCAMTPLITLIRQVPELNDAIDQKTLTNCFANIAHIMPGF